MSSRCPKDSERMLALFFLRIVGGWKTLGPREQGSSYGLFIAIRMVRVESEIFVGVYGFTVYTCFLSRKVKHLSFSRSKVNWMDDSTEFKRDRKRATSFTDTAERTSSKHRF